MNVIKIYNQNYLLSLTKTRDGETKFGEKVQTVYQLSELKSTTAKFVIFGIPEDIGVRANYGFSGTKNTWKVVLKSLLNIQANSFTQPENSIILGEIDCDEEMILSEKITISLPDYYEKLGKLVEKIDEKVAQVVETIVTAGKIPIIIGGGHNNSYGNIRGTSEALKKAINCINIDAHTDFRKLEHRHSGNGFSYAFHQKYLKNYFIIGLHKNYTSSSVFDEMEKKNEFIRYTFFENIFIEKNISLQECIKQAEDFCCTTSFGLEIDLDAVQDIPSSALTPSGFSVNEVRQMVSSFSKNKNSTYLHLCEASPKPDTEEERTIGKLISYLIIDFIC